MANEEHLAILRQGIEVWNRWRRENPTIRPNLRGANLHGADLQRADLHGVDLYGSDLYGSDLEGANLEGANLIDANLQSADLVGADLTEADLTEVSLAGAKLTGAKLTGAKLWETNLWDADLTRADLTGASLAGADLKGTILQGTILREAEIGYTTLADLDLREVQDLETLLHVSPSTVGINTIYRSEGNIPENFLKGAGVPDSFIEYMHSLTVRPIDYYSVFISYSSHDEAIAQRLHADLQAQGVRCWFAPHNLEIGAPIVRGIDEAIRIYDKLLIILSEAAVTSRWVDFEVSTALHREVEQGRTMLFPIRLDDAVLHTPSGWAAQLRSRNIGDFRGWKDHDRYQEAFARLLRDLKAKD